MKLNVIVFITFSIYRQISNVMIFTDITTIHINMYIPVPIHY